MKDFQIYYPELFALRHTSAEILAAAVTALFPEVKPLGAKATNGGFSYTFVFPKFTDTFLEAIERKILEIIKEDLPIDIKTMVYASAKGYAKHIGLKRALGESLEYYFFEMGSFVDLADASQMSSSGEIPYILLTGFEKQENNIVEIFGNSFFEKKDFKDYQKKKNKKELKNSSFIEGPFLSKEGIEKRDNLVSLWKNALVKLGFDFQQNLFPSRRESLLSNKKKLLSQTELKIDQFFERGVGLLDTEVKTQSVDLVSSPEDFFLYLQSIFSWLNSLGLDSFSLFLSEKKEEVRLKNFLSSINISYNLSKLGKGNTFLAFFIEDPFRRPWKIFEIISHKEFFEGRLISFERILGLLEQNKIFF